MWAWLIGVVNTKRNIRGDPGLCCHFEAKPTHSLVVRYNDDRRLLKVQGSRFISAIDPQGA